MAWLTQIQKSAERRSGGFATAGPRLAKRLLAEPYPLPFRSIPSVRPSVHPPLLYLTASTPSPRPKTCAFTSPSNQNDLEKIRRSHFPKTYSPTVRYNIFLRYYVARHAEIAYDFAFAISRFFAHFSPRHLAHAHFSAIFGGFRAISPRRIFSHFPAFRPAITRAQSRPPLIRLTPTFHLRVPRPERGKAVAVNLDFPHLKTVRSARADLSSRILSPFLTSPPLLTQPYSLMSLKIRLTKVGSVHQALYRIVVAEARSRRDGAPVETLGTYSPNSKGKQIAVTLDLARVDHWVGKGAVPTDTVKSLVKKARRAAGASVVATT